MTHYYSSTQESSLSPQPVGEGSASMCNRRPRLLQGVLQAKQIEERKEVCNLFFSFTRRTEAQRYGMNCQGSYKQVVGEPEPELTSPASQYCVCPTRSLFFSAGGACISIKYTIFQCGGDLSEQEGKFLNRKTRREACPAHLALVTTINPSLLSEGKSFQTHTELIREGLTLSERHFFQLAEHCVHTTTCQSQCSKWGECEHIHLSSEYTLLCE